MLNERPDDWASLVDNGLLVLNAADITFSVGNVEGIVEGNALGIVEGIVLGIVEGNVLGIVEGKVLGIAEGGHSEALTPKGVDEKPTAIKAR